MRTARTWRLPLGLLGLLVASLLLVTAVTGFIRTADQGYASGDGAFLELYTIHASQGRWKLGPYSQFQWHHPGPLFFYLLAPLYELGDSRSLALNVGALAINLVSVIGVVWVVLRWASPPAGAALLVTFVVYLVRVNPLLASFWNPHVLALPLAALLVLCAGLASGRYGTLPAIVIAGSFLTQTHVSLVPCVAALVSAALLMAFAGGRSGSGTPGRWTPGRWTPERWTLGRWTLGRWLHVSAWVWLLVWSLPIVEQVSASPGNMTKLARFFSEPSPTQHWDAALSAWGNSMTAIFHGRFRIPVGWPVPQDDPVIPAALAGGQILALLAAWRVAARRGDRFEASLCLLGALASMTAFWSITRIRTTIGDYMVFWMSVVGALNWALLAAVAAAAASSSLPHRATRTGARLAALLAVPIVVYYGTVQLDRIRDNSLQLHGGDQRRVRALSNALDAAIRDEGVKKALVRISPGAWGEGAGVVLQLYKRGTPVAVQPELVVLYGEAFAPNGQEDRVFHIVDTATHLELAKRPGDRVITERDRIFIHTDDPAPAAAAGAAPADDPLGGSAAGSAAAASASPGATPR